MFKILKPNEPFLFKLKAPINAIAGVGFFSSHTFLPLSMAWEVFGNGNGCNSFHDFQKMISKLRQDRTNQNPVIGCIVLTNPIFFESTDWIQTPENWSRNIVQGKTYSTDSKVDRILWNKVEEILQKYLYKIPDEEKSQLILDEPQAMYGLSLFKKIRLGQGAFRILVTDAYGRRCAISGEKTLPVLEAAHINTINFMVIVS